MSRRRFAPSHDLVARMRFVPASDGAWRSDLIDAECAKMSAHVEPEARASVYMHSETGHPFWRYIAGATRFDLTAAELDAYLDRGAAPETWTFRRLTLAERSHCTYLERAEKLEESRTFAFLAAALGVENATGETGRQLCEALAATPRVSADVLKAAENYAATAVQEVGAACIRGSQDLTSWEKKA